MLFLLCFFFAQKCSKMPSLFSPKKKKSRHAPKAGRKKGAGRPTAARSPQSIQQAALSWKQKNNQLLVALAGRQGEAYDAGAVVMALPPAQHGVLPRGQDRGKRLEGA
jgi:hypothetical protein